MNNNSKIIEAELAVKMAELSVAKAIRDLELIKGDVDIEIKGHVEIKDNNEVNIK